MFVNGAPALPRCVTRRTMHGVTAASDMADALGRCACALHRIIGDRANARFRRVGQRRRSERGNRAQQKCSDSQACTHSYNPYVEMRPQRREDAAAQVTKSHGISVMRSRRSLSHSVDAKRRPASGGISITGTIVACMRRRAAAQAAASRSTVATSRKAMGEDVARWSGGAR